MKNVLKNKNNLHDSSKKRDSSSCSNKLSERYNKLKRYKKK